MKPPISMPTAVAPRLAQTLAASLVLAVGMGFGRFAFTGMYPLMVRDGMLSVATGSLAASANYAGYLLGALLISRLRHAAAARLCQAALGGTVLCLLAVAFPVNPWCFIAVRFLAGIFSAFAMIAASVWLLQVVGHAEGAPMLYAGVGLGILISAELIALGNLFSLRSTSLWLALAVASAAIAGCAWPQLNRRFAVPVPAAEGASAYAGEPPAEAASDVARKATNQAPAALASAATDNQDASLGPWSLVVIYGLAGFGYIVTATYLPLFVRHAVGQIDPVHIWAVFGLGAMPACFFWHALHVRVGTRRAMILCLAAQACGVVLPALSHTPVSFLSSAILVGGTFVGTVTIAMHAAKRVADSVRFNILALLTAAYGLGQIIGPLVSGALFARTQSFDLPLLVAGAALLLACLPAAFEFEPDATRPMRSSRRRAIQGQPTSEEKP